MLTKRRVRHERQLPQAPLLGVCSRHNAATEDTAQGSRLACLSCSTAEDLLGRVRTRGHYLLWLHTCFRLLEALLHAAAPPVHPK